jgi:hypothetical protein
MFGEHVAELIVDERDAKSSAATLAAWFARK